MEKFDKRNLILLVLICSLLLFNIMFSIYHSFDYESRKNSGNEKWQEVYNIILENKNEINNIKEQLTNESRNNF